jgi:hypothetical protein
MQTNLDPIFSQLREASQSLSAGQLEQACARLCVASNLLNSCLSEQAQEQASAPEVTANVVNLPDGNRQATAQKALAMAG